MSRAFTLVELLIVITIIGVLSIILVPNIVGALSGSQETKTKSLIKNLQMPMDTFADKHNRYPDADDDDNRFTMNLVRQLETEGLHSFEEDDLTGHPDFDEPVLCDGWNTPVRYRPWKGIRNKEGAFNRRTYDMWSAGADGEWETWNDNLANFRIPDTGDGE